MRGAWVQFQSVLRVISEGKNFETSGVDLKYARGYILSPQNSQNSKARRYQSAAFGVWGVGPVDEVKFRHSQGRKSGASWRIASRISYGRTQDIRMQPRL